MGLDMVAIPSEYTLAELPKQAQAPHPLPRDRLDGPVHLMDRLTAAKPRVRHGASEIPNLRRGIVLRRG